MTRYISLLKMFSNEYCNIKDDLKNDFNKTKKHWHEKDFDFDCNADIDGQVGLRLIEESL